MPTYHVSLRFAQLPDAALSDFTANVIAGLTGNDEFPTPKVPVVDLASDKAAFDAALVAAAGGGPQATATKNAAREKLLKLLRCEAYYVQSTIGDNLAALLSSGFEAASTNKTQSPLPAPQVLKIQNEQSTQLVVQLKRVTNAKAYEVQKMNGTGGWTMVGVFTKARRIVVGDLVPGSVYSLKARAVGGSTGYSGWSDPVSHMAM